MAKRSVRPQSPKRETDTAEPAHARTKRSRTAAEEPVVTADDSSPEALSRRFRQPSVEDEAAEDG